MGADVAISPHFPGPPRCPEGWLQTGRIGSPSPCGQVPPLGSRPRIAAPALPCSNRLAKHRCSVQRPFRISLARRLRSCRTVWKLGVACGLRRPPISPSSLAPPVTRLVLKGVSGSGGVSKLLSVSGRSLRSTSGRSHGFRVAATHRCLWITWISGMESDYFRAGRDAPPACPASWRQLREPPVPRV
jgi:hypothetical protein